MNDAAEVDGELYDLLRSRFVAYGENQDDGRSFLEEVANSLDGLRMIFRPNESQHRGRPHCLVEVSGKSATFDIITGERLAGDIRPLNRTAKRVIEENSEVLVKKWNDTRPDDQKLKDK